MNEDYKVYKKSRNILAEDETIESKILREKVTTLYVFAIEHEKFKVERELMTKGVMSFLNNRNYNDLFDFLVKQKNVSIIEAKEWIANHVKEMSDVFQGLEDMIEGEIYTTREQLREIEELEANPYRGHSYYSMPGM